MRVNANGQVTLPRELLERVGIRPGEEIELGHEGNVITLRKLEKGPPRELTKGEKFVDSIAGTATLNQGVPTDELMKLLRGDD